MPAGKLRIEDIGVGQRLIDSWYRGWGAGSVVWVKKTRLCLRFIHRDMVYDSAHVQFLERER